MLDQQRQMQAEAEQGSRQTARLADLNRARGHEVCNAIARDACADQVARLNVLESRKHELAAERQESQHELRALMQLDPADGEEEAHDQRGASLTWRVQRLERQIAHINQEIEENRAMMSQTIARVLEHANRINKQKHNALKREGGAKIQKLVEQMQALQQEYDQQVLSLQADRADYMAAAGVLGVQVNLGELDTLAGSGLFRDVE